MSKPTLKEMLKNMDTVMNNRDLSDDYLAKHGNMTREDAAYGDWSYGITMVPCSWVYPYLEVIVDLKDSLEDGLKDCEECSCDGECDDIEQHDCKVVKEIYTTILRMIRQGEEK